MESDGQRVLHATESLVSNERFVFRAVLVFVLARWTLISTTERRP